MHSAVSFAALNKVIAEPIIAKPFARDFHLANLLSFLGFAPGEFVADQYDRYIHSFHLLPDGKLVNSEPFCRLEIKDGARDAECTGLCVDTNGWLYVATSLGIQVCDQAGRMNFILSTPKVPLDVCFGGKDLSELFIACGDAIYKRPTKAQGIVSGQMAPITPPKPKL